MPSLRCTMVAVDGKTMSGVEVATMIRSMSAPVSCAASSAPCRLHRQIAGVLVSSTKWRARMPVRSTIQSSELSMPSAARRRPDRRCSGVAGQRTAGAGNARMAGCGGVVMQRDGLPGLVRRRRAGTGQACSRVARIRSCTRSSRRFRAASYARFSAFSKASASAEPWLLNTRPRRPSSAAPLKRR